MTTPPFTLWLTGLPASGKTTLAQGVHKSLVHRNIKSVLIDGDIFREQFCSDLGFSINDRHENIRRAASMARLVNDSGVIAICSFVSPTRSIRELAASIIGLNSYLEVFVDAPVSVCIERDPKGLYLKARTGIIKEFTGVSSPYDVPHNPFCSVDTSRMSVNAAVNYIIESLG